MAMTPKAKAAFLRRINKGRRKAGLKPIRAKRAKGAKKAKRASAPKKSSGTKRPRRARRSAKQKAATKRMIAARRAQLSGAEPRKTKKRKSAAKKGHSMAKRRKSRKSAPKKHRKHRRKGRRTVTVTGFRRVTMSNPLKLGALVTGITGLASGATTGLITTKLMGDYSMGIRAAGSVVIGLLGSFFLKKRPALAEAWGATAIGSIGYGFAVNAAGGVVATNKADAIAAIAKMPDPTTKSSTSSSSSAGQSGMGVLVPLSRPGMGVLTSVPNARALTGRGMNGPGAVRNPRALVGLG